MSEKEVSVLIVCLGNVPTVSLYISGTDLHPTSCPPTGQVISVEGTSIITPKNTELIDERSLSSPMGHAVLEHEARKRGLPVVVDSAGTAAYHVGEPPDERTVATCEKYSVPIDHLARAATSSDFREFDYILASDSANLANLQRMAPGNSTATIALFGSFGDGKPIADPYYGGINGFEKAYDQCVRYSTGFLNQVFGKEK